jgi:hypothetical protein
MKVVSKRELYAYINRTQSILSPVVFSMSGQNTNKKKIHYRGLLFHLLDRFGLRSIYMLVPEMFRNLLGRGKGIVAFWTCKASIRHHV